MNFIVVHDMKRNLTANFAFLFSMYLCFFNVLYAPSSDILAFINDFKLYMLS